MPVHPEQATEYIHKMIRQIESIVPKRYCENNTVNLLLSLFEKKTEIRGSKCLSRHLCPLRSAAQKRHLQL